MNNGNCYSHHIQPCSGDTPYPSQGHSACLVGKYMYVFGGDGQWDDMYRLDLEGWAWKKLTSITQTEVEERPETDAIFSSLSRFDENSIVLIGGLLGKASRSMKDAGGFALKHYANNPIADNLHIYSLKTGKWTRIPSSDQAPRGWQIHAHNIGTKQVLILGGHSGCNSPNINPNCLHMLRADADGVFVWEKIEENKVGIPPSVSSNRASAWVPSARSLMLHGGRYLNIDLDNSILKAKNNEEDMKTWTLYDTELYCFNLDLKQWIRFHVSGETIGRHSHTMTNINDKLVVLGGCVLANRAKAAARDYVTKVSCYNLDFSKLETASAASVGPTQKRGKGKRKGKKKK